MRFNGLFERSGWYPDEGSVIVAAQSLNGGEWNYLGLKGPNLLSGRQPVMPALVALILRSTSLSGIQALRMLTASLSVITAGLLFLLPGWLRMDRPAAAGAVLAGGYALLPFTVLYSRLGFSYNLPALLVPLILLSLHRYLVSGRFPWLAAAGLLAGFGFLTALWMAAVFPICVMAPLFRNRRDVLPGLAALLAIPAVYLLWLWFAYGPDLIYDLSYLYGRIQLPLRDQIGLVLANFSRQAFSEPWFVIGLSGLFLVPQRQLRGLVLVFFFTAYAFSARSVGYVGLGRYQFLPLSPLVALGIAAFLLRSWDVLTGMVSARLRELKGRFALTPGTVRLLSVFLAGLVLGIPWLYVLLQPDAALAAEQPAALQAVLLDPAEATRAAEWINSRVGPGGVVIASPGLAWLLEGRATDFQVSLAYGGFETRHFPTDIPQARFSFDPSIDHARFVVVDRVWDNWAAANVPDMAVLTAEIEDWPLAATFGEFRIYANPASGE